MQFFVVAQIRGSITSMRTLLRGGWVLPAVLSFFVVSATGQDPRQDEQRDPSTKPITSQTHPNNPELWNVDAMMEDAVLQIARRYNLNKAQEQYTRLLLTSRVRAFLEEREPEIRELLKESIDLRRGLKEGSLENYKRWATRAAPLYLEAQKAILEGNDEWRGILNDDQKKIHDADLGLMKNQFGQVTRIMEDWKGGKGIPGMPGSPGTPSVGGIRSGGPEMSKVSDAQPGIRRQLMEDNWLAYTNLFIQTFNLDEKQTVAARDKIHKEIRDDARKYREKRKDDFAAIEEQAKSPKPKWPAPELSRRRAELERPLQDMFKSLHQRLDQLPTSKQRAEANPNRRTQLETMYKSLVGEWKVLPDASQRPTPMTPRMTGATSRKAENTEPEKQPAADTPKPAGEPEVPPT